MPAIEEFPDVAETSAVHEFPAIEEFPDADAAAAGGAESVSPPSSAFDSSRLGADQAALLNLQDTLRGYNPAALNPMPEPAGGALVEATETPLDKVWRLVRQSKALRPVFGDPGSSGDDFQQRGIPATLASIPARPFVGAGKGAQAVVGDVAELEQGNPTLENLSAASRGEALPVLDKIASAALEEHERGEFGVPSLLAHISLGMADLAPKLLAMQGGPAMAGSVFGTGPDNSFDVSAGAMGAVLPGISEGTRAVVADAVDAGVKRGATWLAQPAVEKTLQVAANQAAMDGVMALQQSPELLELAESDPREFKRRVAELVGSNLAFAVPEIMRKTPTQEMFEGREQPSNEGAKIDALARTFPEQRAESLASYFRPGEERDVNRARTSAATEGIEEFPAESSPAEAVPTSDPGLVQTPGAVTATPAAPESSLVPESGTLQAIAAQKPVTAQRVARVEASKPYTVEQALKDLPSVVQELKAALEANRLKPAEVSTQIAQIGADVLPKGATRETTVLPKMATPERPLEYTLLDAVKDNGGLGGPDLETAMREMAAGKTAAQVAARYGAEYDALADVLETIFEARRGKKNNNVANQLAKAYEQAGFGGNRKGVDQALLGMTEAHQQGMGVAGGLPADHGDLIGRAWEQAQTRAKGGRELPKSAEGKAELFWQTATEPQNKVGLNRIFLGDLQPGDTFRLRGKELTKEELTVTSVDKNAGTVTVKGGETFGIQELPQETEVHVSGGDEVHKAKITASIEGDFETRRLYDFWSKSAKGKHPVVAKSLLIGDVVTVDKTPLEVTDVNTETGAVTLNGGNRFGEVTLQPENRIGADKVDLGPEHSFAAGEAGGETRVDKAGQGSLFKAGKQKPAGWDEVKPGTEQQTLDVGAGKRFAEYMRKSFPNTLPVEIVATAADLPAGVQRRAQALGVSGVKGVVTEGKVYLVAGNLRDVREAGRIWLHEQAGHFATDKVLGPQLRSFAAGVEKSFRNSDLMADIRRRYPGADEVTLGREYMAKLAENPATDPAAWRKVVARVRQWLRSLGFNLEVSENDVREVLRRAMGSLKGEREGVKSGGVENRAELSAGDKKVERGYVPPRFQMAKPIVGPTGARIVGYEWRSMMGEKWSNARQEYVEARVSDWDASDKSTGTGRDIVHVFYVEHPDGVVRPEGIRSAQNVLGINETRLMTIAKKERAAQQYREQQERSDVEAFEKVAKPTAAEAARDYRQKNYSPMRSFEENDQIFRQSVLFEKNGKFVRRGPNATERMERAGWALVTNDPAKPAMAANPVAESGSIREAKPAGKTAGKLIQDTLFAAGEPAERIAELRRPVQELEDKLRAANRLVVHPDQRRAAGLSKQQAANQRDVATAEFRRAQEALRENPEYIEAIMRRQNELVRAMKSESDPQRKADMEGEFETLQAELEAAPKKVVAYIHAQKFMTGEERTPREERAGSEAAGTSNIQTPTSNAEISPETPAARRKKVLKELPERTREVFQAAGKTKDKLTNLWTARENRDVIAYTFDAAENGGNLFGKQAANEVLHALNRSFGATGERVTARNPVREQALTFVIESGLQDGELNGFEEQIRGSAFAGTRAGKDALAAIRFAQTHWERLAPVAELYSKITDAQVEHENLAGVETLHRKGGYVFHMEDVAADHALPDYGAGGSGVATPFLKVRQHATYADAVANGSKPKSMNAVDLLQKRLSLGQKKINHGAWVDGMRRMIDPASQLPLVTELQTHVRADGKEYEDAPPGYTVANYAGQKFAILKGGYDTLLKSLTTPSTIRDSVLGNIGMELAGGIKHGMLVFDSYHLGRLAFWNSMVRGMGLPGNPAAYKRGLTLLDQTMPEIRRMVEGGEIPAKLGADLIESKRQLNLLVSKGLNVGGAADNIATHFVQHLPIAGRFNRFLFQEFQRGATAEASLIELRRQQKMFPNVPEEVLARRVAADLNKRFGNLQNQSWIKNKNVADALRMLFLAPQWNESLIRSEIGAVKELGQAIPDSVRNRQLAIGLLGRSVFTAAIGTFLANQVINYITRGKPTWDNEEESEVAKISAWIPDVVGNGPGYFLNPLTLPAEISELLLKKAERSGDITKALKEALASRLGPLGRIPYTLAVREDSLGAKLKTGGEVMGQMVSNLVPAPISGGTIVRAGKQLVTGQPEEKYPGQFQRQAAQTFGIKLDSAPTADQRIGSLAKEFNREKGITPGAEYFHGDYYELDNALRMGNERDARAALEELLQKKTPKDIRKHYETWARARFTGKTDREAEFKRTLNPEQLQTYEKARQRREEIRQRVNGLLR